MNICYFFPVLKYIFTVILLRLLMRISVECYIWQLSNKTNQTKSVLVQSFISTTRFWRIFYWDISLRFLCLHLPVFNSLVISHRLLKPFTFSHARSQNTKYPLTRELWQVLCECLVVYIFQFELFIFWSPRKPFLETSIHVDFSTPSLLNVTRLLFFFSTPKK